MKEKVFIRKTIKIGRSLAVTIPKDIIDELNIEKGDDLKIQKDEEEIRIAKYFK